MEREKAKRKPLTIHVVMVLQVFDMRKSTALSAESSVQQVT